MLLTESTAASPFIFRSNSFISSTKTLILKESSLQPKNFAVLMRAYRYIVLTMTRRSNRSKGRNHAHHLEEAVKIDREVDIDSIKQRKNNKESFSREVFN